MKGVYLYGAGGHAKVIAEMLELQGILIAGVFDDNDKVIDFLHYPVLGAYTSGRVESSAALIISVGDNYIRKKVAESLEVTFSNASHPSVNLSPSAVVGDGTVMMAGVAVNSDSRIGRHVILNTNCTVEHDCIISDYVHISPNAALAGDVQVGEGSHIGIGACVIQGIKIGKWCTIGAGTVIIRDVPDGSTVVGNPARIIKTTDEFL